MGEREQRRHAIPVSALTGRGHFRIDRSPDFKIAQSYDSAAPLLTRARHREALEEAAAALRRSLLAELPELRAEDLRLAWRSLGRITGRVRCRGFARRDLRRFLPREVTVLCSCLTSPRRAERELGAPVAFAFATLSRNAGEGGL